MASTPAEHAAWTAAGADTAAQNTYASVKRALADLAQARSLEIFLQGSYANSTNIRADSDVDIVVMTRSTYRGSMERLAAPTKATYDLLPTATYTATQLREDVTRALIAYYGADRVRPKNKCITVLKRDGYVDADVVPCLQYRWYRYSDSLADWIEGIAIEPVNGGWIINFPKEHIRNGQQKNALCTQRYKSTVRQMKNLRNRAVAEGRLADGTAPGYLLECMTYNAPNNIFVSNDSQRLRDVAGWLKVTNKQDFWSCDGIHRLFKTDPGRFNLATAQQITDALWDAY
jgi:predicted nucleotidyltransferase